MEPRNINPRSIDGVLWEENGNWFWKEDLYSEDEYRVLEVSLCPRCDGVALTVALDEDKQWRVCVQLSNCDWEVTQRR